LLSKSLNQIILAAKKIDIKLIVRKYLLSCMHIHADLGTLVFDQPSLVCVCGK